MMNQLFAQADFDFLKMFDINGNNYTHEKIWLKDKTFLVPILFNTATYTLEPGVVITNPNPNQNQDSFKILIAHYNDSAQLINYFTLNSTGYEQLADVTVDSSNNIYLTYLVSPGYILNGQSYFVNSSAVNSKYMMLKTTTTGTVVWNKTFEAGDLSMFSLAIGLTGDVFVSARANQQNIKVDGITYANPTPHTQTNLMRMVIGKLNLNGNGMQWFKSSTNSVTETFSSIFVFNNRQPILRVDSQNNAYLVGTLYGLKTVFEGTILQNIGVNKEKLFMVKYDSNGQFAWAKTPTIPTDSQSIVASQFEIDNNDNLFLIDNYNPGFNGNYTVNYWGQSYTVSKSISSLIKLNTGGNVVWTKQPQVLLQQSNSHFCSLQYFSIVNNKILAFGVFNGSFDYSNGIQIITNETYKWVSLEFNTDGQVDNHYVLPASLNVFPISFIGLDTLNRLWFAQKTVWNNGVNNYFIGTFNFTVPSPTTSAQKLLYFRSAAVTLNNENFSSDELNIYPNPTTNWLNFSGREMLNQNYQIYDVAGKILNYGQIVNNQIQVENLSYGTYILKVYDRNDSRAKKTFKFVKN